MAVTFLVIPVTSTELVKAARLGGLDITLDTDLKNADNTTLEFICDYARYGTLNAIHDSFNHTYPPHYPDDAEGE